MRIQEGGPMSQKSEFSLVEVQQFFEDWRGKKKRRERIPATLWEAAVSLSPHLSAHRISKLLRLNHTAVRDRIRAHNEGICGKTPAFIELDTITPPSVGECTIELERPGGAKIKICFKGNCPDIPLLSKAFLGEA